MAPRSTKTKKAVDLKADNDAPKKGRGKAKNIEEQETDVAEPDLDEKMAVTDKKMKRGKKATNGQNQNSDKSEDTAPPAKKGRKKNNEDNGEEKSANGDHSPDDDTASIDEDTKQNGDTESNGDTEERQAVASKGRKKPQKKDSEQKNKEVAPATKNTKPSEQDETSDVKPKASKGRGRKAQAKVDKEPETTEKANSADEEEKPEPTKAKKKGLNKVAKEKSPESDKEEVPVDKEVDEEIPEEEPKKKEPKGRKNQGKKAQTKEESEEKEVEAKDEPASKKRKAGKKEDKAKGDTKDEEAVEEDISEDKPVRAKRGKKAVEVIAEAEEEPQDTGEQSSKRRRKQAEEKAPTVDKKKAPPKNKAMTNYEELDFSNTSKNAQGKDWNFKVSCWNVDGIRAWLGKGGLDFLKYEKPDILCLQEVKCSKDKLPEELVNIPGYHAYWLCSDQDGYAGVGVYTAKLAMNVQYGLQNQELDTEGRIITAEYEHFYLISTYVPNAGRKLVTLPKRLQWNEEFRKYVKQLDKKKPVIICGDMNVAHNEIDLANPKTNRKNAGFTDEERAGMTELLSDGFVDTFRHLNPDKKNAYTFWTYMMNCRAKNVGWRLDYFIMSERLLASLCDSVIRDGVYGSDHCPISLFLHFSSAEKPK